MKKVLILCTGNSCRSQMAEGLINHLIGDQWQAFSAGTRPAGYVNPLAIAALDEISIDISQQQSQSVQCSGGLSCLARQRRHSPPYSLP